MKLCRKCNIEKPFNLFDRSFRLKNGYQSYCKDCRLKYRIENKEKIKNHSKLYREKNKKILAEKSNIYYYNNKQKIKDYIKNNKQKVRERNKNWKNRNKEKLRIYERKYKLNSYRNNPQVKAKYKLQLSLNKLIRAKSCCENIYGCSVEFLFKHIESQFREGMTWGNYGVGKGKWCIDHILPCKHFNLLEQIDVKKCLHYSNIRPMWFEENCSKGDRIEKINAI